MSSRTTSSCGENKGGWDVWAYKTGLDSYGWKKLAEFDEVVLFNATIMGPVYPFEEMFTEMAGRNIDFWGITWFHEVAYDPFGYALEATCPDTSSPTSTPTVAPW